MTKLVFLTALFGSAGLFLSMVFGPSSSGAPASHTGAPGEQTCAVSGCHDDNALNSGTAKLNIDAGNISNYIPGKTYPIKIQILDAGIQRFGFQITALSLSENKNIGKLLVTDVLKTQYMNNLVEYKDREYITYTFNGTDALEPGVGEWVVNWKAPSENLGPVIFYVGAVSANDNENDKGDFTYTSQLTINDSK